MAQVAAETAAGLPTGRRQQASSGAASPLGLRAKVVVRPRLPTIRLAMRPGPVPGPVEDRLVPSLPAA